MERKAKNMLPKNEHWTAKKRNEKASRMKETLVRQLNKSEYKEQ